MSKSVAIMQPYFFPYAGYFRLLANVDEFVIFDCVQFRRRGRMHRTEVPGQSANSEWLTLPLARQSRQVLIRDCNFAADARLAFDRRIAQFPWIAKASGPTADRVRAFLYAPLESFIGYLEESIRLIAEILALTVTIRRSSELRIDPALRGQTRVLAVAQAVEATRYLNAPGGVDLYDPATFAKEHIDLVFLPRYDGRYFQLLPALLAEDPRAIAADIRWQVS